jgi:endonuclease YncB( thermonuclease family)
LVPALDAGPPAAAPPAAAPALPAATPAPPLPAPPAFHTGSVGRVREITGDSFVFSGEGGKKVRVRLAHAECAPLGKTAEANATLVATNILETETVWVFPCGKAKGTPEDEIWASVWTSKGWLAEVLIRAGYAQRRAALDPAALEPAAAPCSPVPGCPRPCQPAFAAASCAVAEGDAFDTEHAGRKYKVQLADVTCQGLEESQREAAKAEAARLLAAGPFWVLPCSVRRGAGQDEACALVWTQGGWLSDALIKAGLAKPGQADKPATPGTTPGPGHATPPAPPPKPDSSIPSDQIKWREVPVRKAEGMVMSCRSGHFKIDVPEWRVSWNLKPWRTNSPVSFTICRVNENVASSGVSTHVASFTGLSGSAYVRAQPGTFWIQVTGSPELGVKVEVPESP